jgi:hypothetical protein
MRKSAYTILIICEGEKTEPFFFKSIHDLLKKREYDIGQVEISIRPEPNIEEEEELERSPSKPARKKQELRRVKYEPEITEGRPPLKWVLEAQTELADGTFNEAWTVFDHDNHPSRKEAFDEAKKEIEGTTEKVRIAFSSISFEYYLLLHFERIYKAFEKSECRIGRKSMKCHSGENKLDCFGQKCIGGYMRKKGYLIGSTKTSESVFPMIKDQLEIGFENAAWLRYESQNHQSELPIHERNPYITTDELVKRLTGNRNIWTWIERNIWHKFNSFSIHVSDEQNLSISNNGKVMMVIPENSFTEINVYRNRRKTFGSRMIIAPAEMKVLENFKKVSSSNWFIFKYDTQRIMFDFAF